MGTVKKGFLGCLGAFLAGIVILVVIGLLFSGGSDDKPKKVDNSSPATEEVKADDVTTEPDAPQYFRKGETAEMNDIQVTMTEAKMGSGSEYNKPSDGNSFLLVEFEIVNNSDDDLAVSSALSFNAYADDYKLDYSFSALMEKEGNQLDGTISPGKKMKGWIGWEVPTDFSEVEIHFTDNVWSSDKFIFLIKRK